MTEFHAVRKFCPRVDRRIIASGFICLSLTACSVPDYVYPNNWFESKKQKQEVLTAKPIPGKDKAYPKLSSVPARPEPITIDQIRKELTEGLIADSANARHTDEIIRRESPSSPLRAIELAKPPPSPKLEKATALASRTSASSLPVTKKEMPAKTSPAKLRIAGVQTQQPKKEIRSSAKTTSSDVKGSIKIADAMTQNKVSMVPSAKLVRPASPPPSPKLAELSRKKQSSNDQQVQPAQIATIFFGSATSTLTSDDVSVIREVATLQLDTGGVVRLVGHASRGTSGADRMKQGLRNFKISLDRANAVANALVRFGMKKDNIKVIARGDAQLLYAETTAAGIGGNRRVEIFLEFL